MNDTEKALLTALVDARQEAIMNSIAKGNCPHVIYKVSTNPKGECSENSNCDDCHRKWKIQLHRDLFAEAKKEFNLSD